MNTIEPPDLKSQIAALAIAVIVIDPDMRIAQVNPAGEFLLGQSAKGLIHRPLGEILDLDSHWLGQKIGQSDARLRAHGVMVKKVGDKRLCDMTLAPIAGEEAWRIATLQSTNEGAAEGDESAQQREGRAAFVHAPSVLAHEIKNPLSAIGGAGQLLARKLPEGERQLTQLIADEVGRIARLVDRMQALGSTVRQPNQAINLHQSIRSAIATIRAAKRNENGVEDRPTSGPESGPESGFRSEAAERSEIHITEEFDPSLPLVWANPDALLQVLINLLSNAVEANQGREDARILVQTRYSSAVPTQISAGKRAKLRPIEVRIMDNGPGVSEDVAAHIFDPFVSTKKSGQGLGLALVKKLVNDFGGRIGHSRDSERGLTCFRLNLAQASDKSQELMGKPVADLAETAAETSAETAAEPAARSPDGDIGGKVGGAGNAGRSGKAGPSGTGDGNA